MLFFAMGLMSLLIFDSGSAHAAQPESASFTLRGSNGYAVDVSSQGGKVTLFVSERRPPVATFTASGRPLPASSGNGASNMYSTRAETPAPGAVDANLGALGAIAVRFRPSGESAISTLRRVCGRPLRVVRRLGTFVGTIRFNGEEGYTTIAATSAKGSVGTPLPADCGGSDPATAEMPTALSSTFHAGPPAAATFLTAVDLSSGSTFRAAIASGGVSFRAQVEERNADGVVVMRRAYAGAPRASFAFDQALTWATVRPPAPFTGNANFVAGQGGPKWRGTLRVTFPGLSVPLTGPAFRPTLGRP